MKFDICLSPALYPYYAAADDTVIVVDIFRASTTICAMLDNGASAVIPVGDIERAQVYKEQGFLVGGERNAKKLSFADFGNSPFDYKKEVVGGKDIVFTTTNGTQAIQAAGNGGRLYIGAFSNIDALTKVLLGSTGRVVVLCAGWKNRVNLEDTLFAAALLKKISDKQLVSAATDAVKMAQIMWQNAKPNPIKFLKDSDHYKRLVENGAEGDAAFCLTENTHPVVPIYNPETGKLHSF